LFVATIVIDWHAWTPVDRATLIFVVCDDRILLIRKKRGLGAGKINGPGGRLDAGESPLACAVRELREELLIDAVSPREHGELRFHFVDGYGIHAHVFRCDHFAGVPTETDEASPVWFPVDAIPYGEMWADDQLWLPLLIAGRRFQGWFVFDGERMLHHRLEITE
jgi:8-oxo-dGTP diphosphatase